MNDKPEPTRRPPPQPDRYAARFHRAAFVLSVAGLKQLPPDTGREIAFAGRSNAGKSSALNRLTAQKRLARTSKTPGRTQLINFFELGEQRYLVDLPGYGFAKVPEHIQRSWQKLLQDYLSQRRTLRGLCLLMDVRHPMTPLDRQLLDWCTAAGLPCHILLTKADKLKRGPASASLHGVRRALKQDYPPLHSVQLFSSLSGIGVAEAHAQLGAWLYGEDAQDDSGRGDGPPEDDADA